jgi:hypothetical protein
MALAGNEEEECDAKCSVIRAALRLGLAASHPATLCKECEVEPLHHVARPLCALEPVRVLFEAHATGRSAQQWTMNLAAFEKLVQPALPRILSKACSDAGCEEVPHSIDIRALFTDACAARADVGSGWDAPAAGQMTLWSFTEAALRLAESICPPDRAQKASAAPSSGAPSTPLRETRAPALAHVVACLAGSI